MIVVIPRMEARPEEAQPFAGDAREQPATRPVQERDHPQHAAHVMAGATIAPQQRRMHQEHGRPERQRRQQIHANADQVTAQPRLHRGIPYVERHGLVLGFLERMPDPHLAVALDRTFETRRVAQQPVGEHRRVVLRRDRMRKLHRMRQLALHVAEHRPDALVELARGQAVRLHQLVVLDVLARVHRLLADEAEHLLLQHGIVDPVAIVAHGIHEETLAGRKQQRQRVEEMGHVRPEAMPVLRAFDRQVETQVAAHRHDPGCGGGSG